MFGAQSFDFLVDNSGGIGLAVETEGICGDSHLTLFDVLLRFVREMGFELWPSFVSFWFSAPLPAVTGKDGRTGDDDEPDVDELALAASATFV